MIIMTIYGRHWGCKVKRGELFTLVPVSQQVLFKTLYIIFPANQCCESWMEGEKPWSESSKKQIWVLLSSYFLWTPKFSSIFTFLGMNRTTHRSNHTKEQHCSNWITLQATAGLVSKKQIETPSKEQHCWSCQPQPSGKFWDFSSPKIWPGKSHVMRLEITSYRYIVIDI